MHVMRAFIGIHGFKIAEVTHNMILVDDAIATEHISAVACDLKGFSGRVALND